MYEFKIITSLVIVNEEGKFLLGKRSMDEDVFPGLWSIPGGKVEHGPRQLDVLEDNVKKEALEEIGVKVTVDNYIQSHSDGKGKIYIIFKGRITEGIPMPLEDTEEVAWYNLEDIKEELLCPEVYNILHKVMKMHKFAFHQ
ncbi:MAG: NUDIX hydrolase [Nanoarchaeota archaeon]|nr:NUDIX hydrolase [Nanoarchaeota archaeon]MCK5159085.1 NUDIX hydrolase [Candidatus Heimdallarchaeota archaeon]